MNTVCLFRTQPACVSGIGSRMQFEELIQQFATRIGYPSGPAVDTGGGYAFRFDGLHVVCQDEEGTCLFMGSVGAIAGEGPRREETIRHMLQAALTHEGADRVLILAQIERSTSEYLLL